MMYGIRPIVGTRERTDIFMEERRTTEAEQEVSPVAARSPRFRFARRFAVEALILGVGITAGVAFANLGSTGPDMPRSGSLLAQTAAVVGDAVQNAVAPATDGGTTIAIDLGVARDAETSVSEKLITGSAGSGGPSGGGSAAQAPGKATLPKPAAPSESLSPVPPKTTAAVAPTSCAFSSGGGAPKRTSVFNELAWMGSPASGGTDASAMSANEWMELRNLSGETAELDGFHIISADGSLNITIGDAPGVGNGGFALLERTDDDTVPGVAADFIYVGGLANGGEHVKLFTASCELLDEVQASAGWPAGETDTKRTMERNADGSWHTSASVGGTPKATNSAGAPPAPAEASPAQNTTSSGSGGGVGASGTGYRLTVQRSGAGSGIVQSTDGKIICGADCTEDYAPNTAVTLKAYTESGTSFGGWSMPCSGAGSCGLMMTGAFTVVATFNSVPVTIVGTDDDGSENTGTGGTGTVRVSEIMAGSDGNSDNEFVELYNPTDNPIALTGWKINKKSSTGNESLFVASSRFEGKVIPARKYFLIVHEGLYQGVTPADMSWPTSYNIAYSQNSVVLYDGTGAPVETVSWTDIPVGQSYARTSWDGSTFVVGTPTPQNSSN